MLHYLRACGGPLAGSVFILGERTLLGRCGEADVQLTEREVSRRHALILSGSEGRLRIGDLESVNGTFVNGERVDGQVLVPGALLRIGKSYFIYGETAGLSQLQQSSEDVFLQLLSGPVKDRTVVISEALQSAARDFDSTFGDETFAGSTTEPWDRETLPIIVEPEEAKDSWKTSSGTYEISV